MAHADGNLKLALHLKDAAWQHKRKPSSTKHADSLSYQLFPGVMQTCLHWDRIARRSLDRLYSSACKSMPFVAAHTPWQGACYSVRGTCVATAALLLPFSENPMPTSWFTISGSGCRLAGCCPPTLPAPNANNSITETLPACISWNSSKPC